MNISQSQKVSQDCFLQRSFEGFLMFFFAYLYKSLISLSYCSLRACLALSAMISSSENLTQNKEDKSGRDLECCWIGLLLLHRCAGLQKNYNLPNTQNDT